MEINKEYPYKRICSRCGKSFRSKYKLSKICKDCDESRNIDIAHGKIDLPKFGQVTQ